LELAKWTPVLVAIIGFSSPVLITIISDSLSAKGPMLIFIKENPFIFGLSGGYTNTTILKITNMGESSANNVSIILDSPSKMMKITKNYGPFEIFLNNNKSILRNMVPLSLNNDAVDLHIEKIINGEGSEIKLTVITDKKVDLNRFRGSILFNEGSAVAKSPFESMAFSWWFMPLFLISYFGTAIYLLYILYKKSGGVVVRKLQNTLIGIREAIKKDSVTKAHFKNFWEAETFFSSAHGLKRIYRKNMVDYIMLEDFSFLIKERNSKLNDISEDDLFRTNNLLLSRVEKILTTINWSKYP
jgi:hypothetical protein